MQLICETNFAATKKSSLRWLKRRLEGELEGRGRKGAKGSYGALFNTSFG